jgi:RNase P subunit RPR2
MEQKVFISRSNTVTFTCPACNFPRQVSLEDHKELEQAVRVTVTCTQCGHRYRASIERRRQYRKSVNFPGMYTHLVNGKPLSRGYLKVVDLSRTGLKIKLNEPKTFAPGERLLIEFHLDDAAHSLVKKQVEVKKTFDDVIGVAFTSVHVSDPSDRALGFYLFG